MGISKEIERKWILEGNIPDWHKVESIDQNYISTDPETRIRRIHNPRTGKQQMELTVKTGIMTDRKEITLGLPTEAYVGILRTIDAHRISKVRYYVKLDDKLTATVDDFRWPDVHYKIIEVEFSSKQQMQEFTPPDWFGGPIEVSNADLWKEHNDMNEIDIDAIEQLNANGPVSISYDWHMDVWDVMIHRDYSPPGEEGTHYGDGAVWSALTLREAIKHALDASKEHE